MAVDMIGGRQLGLAVLVPDAKHRARHKRLQATNPLCNLRDRRLRDKTSG
jgi:hypothetical protein